MIVVIQVVDQASVSIFGKLKETERKIDKGLVVFLGVSRLDSEVDVNKLIKKIIKLRVFPDDNKKMNLDVKTIGGEVLLISQFTLFGNVKKCNRPDFFAAADKELAVKLYDLFTVKLTEAGLPVKTGYFGEHMKIDSNLNGPVTIIMESDKI